MLKVESFFNCFLIFLIIYNVRTWLVLEYNRHKNVTKTFFNLTNHFKSDREHSHTFISTMKQFFTEVKHQQEDERYHIFKMAIVPSNFPKEFLSQKDGNLVQQYILEMVARGYHRELHPHFNSCVFSREGVLILTFPEEGTLTWLKAVIKQNNEVSSNSNGKCKSNVKPSCSEDAGCSRRSSKPKLRIIDFNSIPHYTTKIRITIPGPKHEDPEDILTKLEVQNSCLKTEKWRVLENIMDLHDHKNQDVVVLVDEPSVKVLIEKEFSLHLNFGKVGCTIVGKVRRDEVTGQIRDARHAMDVFTVLS